MERQMDRAMVWSSTRSCQSLWGLTQGSRVGGKRIGVHQCHNRNGNSGLTRQESSTRTWYDSGSFEVKETVTFHWLKTLEPPDLLGILMPWMWTRSISLLVKEWSIYRTENTSSATRKDVTCLNTRVTLEEEEDPHHHKNTLPGGRPWRPEMLMN